MYKTKRELEQLQGQYNAEILNPTPKEGLVINPKVAYYINSRDIVESIPQDSIEQSKDIYGKLTRLSLQDPVRNTKWDYLYFVNSDVFRPAAIAFEKSVKDTKGTKVKPSYTKHVKGTKAYKEFWKEEFRRIKHGYEPIVDGKPCGIRISGEYYFYLNYTLMEKIKRMPNGNERSYESFPDFLTMDYYYFRELESRENPHKFGFSNDYKKSMVVAKSRRKGFSFKAAAGCVWIAAFNNNARVAVASAPNAKGATDAVRCVRKCIPILDHLSRYTPFGRKNPGDPKTNGGWRHENLSNTDSYVSVKLGLFNTKTKEKKGRRSEIFTLSLSKDDSASGEGLHRIYFEEAGKISNLDKAWIFARPTLKAGSMYRGIAIIFGTGGEMVSDSGEDGRSRPFANIFYGPIGAEVAAYENIHEYKENPENRYCGYFVCDMWANFGATVQVGGKKYIGLDDQGNAFFWVSELKLNKERREKMPPASKQNDYNQFLTQHCKTPGEAFLVASNNIFNTADLIARQSIVKTSKGGFSKLRVAGELIESSHGEIYFKPDTESRLRPIVSTGYDNLDNEGCLLLYDYPQKVQGVIPDDAYMISVDPIKNKDTGSSYVGIVVMQTPKYAHLFGPEKVVATYMGRRKVRPMTYVHGLLVKLSKFFNAKITYENDEDGGILLYFTQRNMLNRLMPFPSLVTQKHIPNSKTLLRTFGHAMSSDRHKAFGEAYLSEWLDYRHPGTKSVDEEGNEVVTVGKRNLDMLEDELIIDQLINYNRKGNYDMVMALMGAIIQFQERFNETETIDQTELAEVSSSLVDFYVNRYGSHRTTQRKF